MLAAMTTAPHPRPGREAGKRRIRDATRWTLAGALSATGLFAGLVSAHHATTTPTTSTAASSQSTTSNDDDDGSRSTATTAPTQLQPTTVQPSTSDHASVSSGAS